MKCGIKLSNNYPWGLLVNKNEKACILLPLSWNNNINNERIHWQAIWGPQQRVSVDSLEWIRICNTTQAVSMTCFPGFCVCLGFFVCVCFVFCFFYWSANPGSGTISSWNLELAVNAKGRCSKKRFRIRKLLDQTCRESSAPLLGNSIIVNNKHY